MNLTLWDYGLILVFVFVLLYFYGKSGLDYFEKRQIKHIKPHAYVGNLSKVVFGLEHFITMINRIYSAFPDQRYIGAFEFRNPVIWLRDTKIIKQVLVKDFDHFVDHRNILPDQIDPLFTNSLFALKGQKWRDMRSTLSPAFTSSKMRNMYPLIIECAKEANIHLEEEINNAIKDGKEHLEIEVKDFFTRYTNDVIATSAFGIKINSLKEKKNEFYTMGTNITAVSLWSTIKFMAYLIFPKIMQFFKVSFMKQDVADFFRSLVNKTMHIRKIDNIVRPDMIHLLMQAKKGTLTDDEKNDNTISKDDTKKRIWSDDELISQAFLFFLAGFETSSILLAYMSYEIATRPEIQKNLINEVNDVIKNNGMLTYETLLKMKYLDMFVSETLRFWPPTIGVDRVCVKPYKLPPPDATSDVEYQVNIGDVLFVPIRALHKDPKYFPDPENFMPERFSDENKESIDPFAYLPFGGGPRACIGLRFAQMEVKIAIVHMLLKFEFISIPKTEDPRTAKTAPSRSIPDNGIWIGLKTRKV